MFRVSVVRVVSVIWAIAMPALALAQAQAANGNIEGTVKDGSGAVLPGVAVTVTNMDTGAARSVLTNEQGVYRAILLPLGSYTIAAELQGFRKYEQTGLSLSAGPEGGAAAPVNVRPSSAASFSRRARVSGRAAMYIAPMLPGALPIDRSRGHETSCPAASKRPTAVNASFC